MSTRSLSVSLALILAGCGGAAVAPKSAPPLVSNESVASSADRSPDDVALDAGRKPAELLRFLGIAPGMHVAELGAGGGYSAELLARAVGPTGVVFGQNSPFLLQKFAEAPWSARLAKPIMKNVQRVDREFDDPLPESARNLDLVFINLFYHDTVWLKADRTKMNTAIFRSLKKDGLYVVADHSGRPGSGVSEVQTLHRIEESVVRSEVTAAGFVLVEEGTFLRNPADARDWNASPKASGDKRGQSDRFVLKFKKP